MQHKIWLSPLLAVLFIGVTFSGLLMFLHLKIPGFKTIHEWGGLFFMVLGIVHLTLNWKLFARYLPKKAAMLGAVAGVAALLLAVLIAPQDNDRHERGYNGKRIHSFNTNRH